MPSAEEEEKEGSRRAKSQVWLPSQCPEYKDCRAEGNLHSPPPSPYSTQCTSRLSRPRQRPLQTLVLGRWRTRRCSQEEAAAVAAPLLSMQQVPALLVMPHLPRIFRLRRCFSSHLLQHLVRQDHSLRLHKA